MRSTWHKLLDLPNSARVVLTGCLLLAVATAATLAYGGGHRPGSTRAPSPDELAALDVDGGRILVDHEGRPVRGPDGKPLRVARDGRTLVDEKGKALRGRDGRPLTLRPDRRLPSELDGGSRRSEHRSGRHKRRTRKRPPRRKTPKPNAPVTGSPPLVIGLAHVDPDTVNTVNSASGAHARAQDLSQHARAVVDHINARGGIGGRRVDLRSRQWGNLTGGSSSEQSQELCTHFEKEGPKPLAVIRDYLEWSTLNKCLAAADIGHLPYVPWSWPTAYMAKYSNHLFTPTSLASDRFPAPYVKALTAARFFVPGEKVGFYRTAGTESTDAVAALMRKALEAAGVQISAEGGPGTIDSGTELNSAQAEIAHTVLEFRSKDIERVVISDANNGFGAFAKQAWAQQYRPTYGINTAVGPIAMLDSGVPPDAFRGAVGIGWNPNEDVFGADEGPAVAAARRRCDDIFATKGLSAGQRNTSITAQTYHICDTLLALQQALKRPSSGPAPSVRAGLESLGSNFESSLNLRSRVDSGHHDGSAGYRGLRYTDACKCFRYEGPVLPID